MPRRLKVVVRIGLVLLAAAVSAGCWHRDHEVADAWQWSDQLPAGATIHLRNLNGAIHVRSASGATATVVGSKRWRFGHERDVQFATKRVGDDVYVCAIWGSSGQCDENGYVSRGRRFFRILGFHFGSDAMASLRLDIPPGVKVDASTTNGSVDIAGARAGGRARTVNGSVVVRQSAGAFDVQSVNGSISVALDSLRATDTVAVTTTNGSVRAELPSTFSGAVSLSTVNGGVRTDMPITTTGAISRRQLDGRVGSGQQVVRIRTINGAISLGRRS